MNGTIRRDMFFRLQFATYVCLIVALVCVLLCVYHYVDSERVRLIISALFAIVIVCLGCSQVIIQHTIVSKFMDPLQKLIGAISECAGEVQIEGDLQEHAKKIRVKALGLQELFEQSNKQYPHEVEVLRSSVIQILGTLEHSFNELSANALMVGMGKICGHVAHDIRGPLATMRLFAQIAPIDPADQDMVDFKVAAQKSCERLNTMAEELLEYRKADAVELKPIDLSSVVSSICQELKFQAGERRVVVDYVMTETQNFFGDAAKLSRVVHNLVSNAIQAVEKQGDGHVSVYLVKENDQISLNIRDNGPGFPQEHVGKMFKTGFTTKGRKGNGLGLIYCANVVKAHGGKIVAHNRSEGGAEIAITLPYEMVQ